MQPKSIVRKFLTALATSRMTESALTIKLTDDPSLELEASHAEVEGVDWLDRIDPNSRYDFVVADLPLGGYQEKVNLNGSTITARSNWVELLNALRLLASNGLCVAVLEPPAFGILEGPRFQEALAKEGFYLNGIFNTPPKLLNKTSVRPVIVVFNRERRSSVFVAELQEEGQAIAVAEAFAQGVTADSLYDGMALPNGGFDGFGTLKARIKIDRLQTQYKDYTSYTLGEIAIELNTVRSGESFQHKENTIYIPTIGNSEVVADLSSVTIKHHNLVQVVLSDLVDSEYVAAFFRSDLGLLVLRSVTGGAFIPRIKKKELSHAHVAVPSLPEQEEIVRSHSQLETLITAISSLQHELALNPRNASGIRGQVENMLETVGALTEAERIMSLAREGESATLEFKESFSLDIKKQTKEKYIELSSLKTIVAFLNTEGGSLLVGVSDDGDVPGLNLEIEKFHKGDADKFLLHFKNSIKNRIGEEFYPYIEYKLIQAGANRVLAVDCEKSQTPCYLDEAEFYVRTNPATDKLEGPKLVEYVRNHFGK